MPETELARFTPAARIKEGGFIRRPNGSWQEITSLVQVLSPAKFAMVTLADGHKVNIPHTHEVIYRTAKQQAAATPKAGA
ncbi:hypothetical protein OG552_10190 [Streptomyces sp. NBC_01476]|uniref:hypothetical protein n=1 Tax=Streptomyces sp. NBC_01476 TaxID=2903881 RepID=UPI002E37695F|nr:hypothetical protein [Streptomyces sp. NBC_01476]